MSEQSKALSTGSHSYTNISAPFQLGECQVQRATEIIGDPDAEITTIRRVLLDAETGREISDPFDLGSHVLHPEPGGAYTFHRVVDEQLRITESSIEVPHKPAMNSDKKVVICEYCRSAIPIEDAEPAGQRTGPDLIVYDVYLCADCQEEIDNEENL